MSNSDTRLQEHEVKCALEGVLLLAAERISSMKDSCKARKHALEYLRIVNKWAEDYEWPYQNDIP
jgi:hypothetical protein